MQRAYRSLFWPILLIGIGVIWLIANLGWIQSINLVSLLRLWPLLLIVIGLDLLIGRKSPLVGGIIGLLTIGAIATLLIFGGSLGINTPSNASITESFTDPIGQTTSASIDLNLAERHTTIKALSNSTNLFEATLTHTGTINFSASGEPVREIRLEQVVAPNLVMFDPTPGDWQIGLAPGIPSALMIDGGSGSSELDLTNLNLTSLSIDMGSGSSIINLPGNTEAYLASIQSGSGSIKLNLPENTSMKLEIDSGSGSISVRLPANVAVMVEVRDDGSGSLNFEGGLTQISGDNETGVWKTSNYDQATIKIEIVLLDRGSGSISIR